MNNKPFNDWIKFTESHDHHILKDLLDDNVVFHSPVIFTPQKGKVLTTMYLMAATKVLKDFKYTQMILEDEQWALRFEGTIGDIKVIGFDVITLNADGRIINFEVLVRPAKAVLAIQQAMASMLEKIKS